MPLYEAEVLESSDAIPSVVIILLHGTFAPDAQWTQKGSFFHESIRCALPNNRLILRFQWTGKNSAMAREEAACRFRLLLKELVNEYPTIPHIVVAHSHGGNIALRAIAKTTALHSVRVLCLSTPVIHILMRPRANVKDIRQSPGFFATAMAVYVGAFTVSEIWVFPRLHGHFVLFLYLSIFGGTLATLLYIAERYHRWSLRFVELSNIYEGVDPTNVLFLRYPGDGASLALTFFQGIQWLINRGIQKFSETSKKMFLWYQSIMGPGGIMFFLIAILALGLGAAIAFVVDRVFGPAQTTDRDIFIFVAPFFIIVGISLILFASGLITGFITLLLIPLLVGLGFKTFGIDLSLAAFWIELTVESAPIGNWKVTTLPTEVADAKLRHSLGYEEHNALDHVALFIRGI